MRTKPWLAFGGLIGAMALVVGWTPAQVPKSPAPPVAPPKQAAPAEKQPAPADEPIPTRLAKLAKVSEESANRLYQALGPVIRDELAKGHTVILAGLGTFRVVRVAEHKDLRGGTPILVPATNTIEFLADGVLTDVANSAGAKPVETVPAFEFNPLPGAAAPLKMGTVRNPGIRQP
jgi:nucleoid DNA-binding protein